MSEALAPLRRNEIREGAIAALIDLPERIGRYEIRGELGRGGMGVVYDGFDQNLTRAIAIKLIDNERMSESGPAADELFARFEREMRATSRMFHPNLVAILDAGRTQVRGKTQAYYVMERIEGESLESRLRRSGPMQRGEGLDLAAAVARGLAAVHAEGLVHRDLKPSNILIPVRGEAKLTDFGLCHWSPDPLESLGALPEKRILGSPHYLAPEQVMHGEIDFRADLFGLGAVLVHLFSGAPPFPASSLSEHFGRIVSDEPDGLSHLDRDVRRLVGQLLSKNRSDRPESAQVVARQLEEMSRDSRARKAWRQGMRRVAIGTGVLVCAAISVGVWVQQDLARLQAEVRLREQELTIQYERARALAPALTSLTRSANGNATDAREELRDEATGALNRIAIERRRYAEAASHLTARLDSLPWSLFASPPALSHGLEFLNGSSVYDPDAHLDARERSELELQLRLLREELDVEARVLFVTPASQQSFEAFGIDAFDSLAAASLVPARGLLLMIDGRSGETRVEVGYGLEPYVSDALAGALARQHLAPGIAAEKPGLDVRLTLRIVRQRLRNAILGGSFALPDARVHTARYAAGGAGASGDAHVDSAQDVPRLGPEARSLYEPGDTVRVAYDRYLHWLRHGDFDETVGLFTPESRELLSKWRGTRVYLDQMSRSPVRRAVEAVERGDRAILYPLSDPLAPPHFFRRDQEGWRIDLAGRERHVIPIAGGPFSWTLQQIDVLPLSEFRNELEVVDGLIRIRRGDNRSLGSAQLARS